MKIFPRQVQNINRFPWIFQNVTFLPANYTKIPVCKGEAGKGGVECPQKGGKLSSHGCHGLSQKDVCCSPVSLFAGKPRGKKETKLLWVFPTYLNFLLSPFFPPCFGFSLSLGRPTLSKATPQQLLDGRRVPRDVSILWAATLSSTKMGKVLLLGPAIPCPKCWRKMKFWGFFLSDSSEAVDSWCGSKRWDISRTFRGVVPRVHRLSKPFGMSNPSSRNAEGKGIQPRDLATLQLQNSQKQTEQKYFCSHNIKPTHQKRVRDFPALLRTLSLSLLLFLEHG